MTKAENKALLAMLKEFKKGQGFPVGYSVQLDKGISTEAVHSNEGKNCGNKIGEIEMYDSPQYIVEKDGEHIFSIVAYNNQIIVMGDSNSEPVTTWNQAFDVGLDYYKNGY